MHKYFNFAKIYEAEQTGEPLNPDEMGTPVPQGVAADPTDTKLTDFAALAKDHMIEIILTYNDFDQLKKGESVLKTDSQAKMKTGDQTHGIVDITSIIINTANDTAKNDKEALVFNLDDPNTTTEEGITNRILNDFKRPETSEHVEVLTGTAQGGTSIPEITVKFLRSTDPQTWTGKDEAIPASAEQKEAGLVVPNATSGTIPNESIELRKILSFNQFVNEGKKKWIADVVKDMKKGALKKELGGEKVTKSKIAEEEAELAKKDKNKKKPGLQLNAKDAKTHKRDILALNLLNAQKGKKK